jgi:RNA polymerase sigma factor (sigma-70 family)
MPPKDPSFSPLPRPDDDAPDSDDHARLPDDATALVEAVQDMSQPQERRDAAWSRLQKVIQKIAYRVVNRLSGHQLKSDFVEQAPTYVWERIAQFDAKRGSRFEAWCATVLCNRLRDWMRRRTAKREVATGSDPETLTLIEEVADHSDWAGLLQRALDREEAFSESDLARVRTWPLRTRLVVLAVSDLWRKVPAPEWETWVEKAGLKAPFPPQVVVNADSVSDRVNVLAECLGMKPNTLSQQWHRGKDRLRDLDYIRQLREEL